MTITSLATEEQLLNEIKRIEALTQEDFDREFILIKNKLVTIKSEISNAGEKFHKEGVISSKSWYATIQSKKDQVEIRQSIYQVEYRKRCSAHLSYKTFMAVCKTDLKPSIYNELLRKSVELTQNKFTPLTRDENSI